MYIQLSIPNAWAKVLPNVCLNNTCGDEKEIRDLRQFLLLWMCESGSLVDRAGLFQGSGQGDVFSDDIGE